MGNTDSKIFLDLGKEVAKAAIKVLTEGEAPPGDPNRIRNFITLTLNLPENATEDDLERAVMAIDPNDDISSGAERFIRAVAIFLYSERNGESRDCDIWVACRECIVKLGIGDAVKSFVATPGADEGIENFCKELMGCEFYKKVTSAGTDFALWKISNDALALLRDHLEKAGRPS